MIRRSTLQTFAESITESLETIAEKIEKVESLIGEAGNVLDSGSDECVGDECDETEVVTPVVDDEEASEDYANDETTTEEDDDEENVVAVPVEEDDEEEEEEEATEAEMYAASIRRTKGKATNFSVNKKPTPASRYAKVKDFLNGKM